MKSRSSLELNRFSKSSGVPVSAALSSRTRRGMPPAGFSRMSGSKRYLSFTLGTLDTPFRKPEAAFSEEALRRLGTSAEDTCLIGDSPYDVAAATVVGMRAYAVATGSHSVDELRQTEAVGVFTDLTELAQAVFGIELGPCFPVTYGRAEATAIRPSGDHEC